MLICPRCIGAGYIVKNNDYCQQCTECTGRGYKDIGEELHDDGQ